MVDTQEISSMGIDEAIEEVNEIIAQFEEGDVGLSEAKELRDRGEELLAYVQDELDVGDGEIKRVE